MKFFMLATALLVTSFTFAKPIPQGDLDLANKYIEQQLEDQGEAFEFKITNGNIEGNKIDAIGVEMNYVEQETGGTGHVVGDLKLKDKVVNMGVVGEFVGSEFFTVDMYYQLESYILEIVESINTEGIYQATLTTIVKKDGAVDVKLALAPASPDAESIIDFELSATFAKDSNEKSSMGMRGNFNATSGLVDGAQVSLMKTFTALKNQKEPSDDDLKGLGDLFEKISEKL